MSDETDNAQASAPPVTRKRSRKSGRPAYVPNDKERHQVRTLAGLGVSHEGISQVIGIAEPTLRKYFRFELSVGAHEANAAVAASLYRQATHAVKPNGIVGIFWMKCRAGWRDHDPGAGKKEAQKEDATRTAEGGGKYAPGNAPLRLVK